MLNFFLLFEYQIHIEFYIILIKHEIRHQIAAVANNNDNDDDGLVDKIPTQFAPVL